MSLIGAYLRPVGDEVLMYDEALQDNIGALCARN
jgi:hypothetical protein